ncbi:MAG: hypothetical protein ACLFVP_07790 [Candidatus Bathyarchaeia archaeon]
MIEAIRRLLITRARPEPEPYYKVRYRWWKPFDLDEFLERFEDKYDIREKPDYSQPGRIEIFNEIRGEIRVKADTLHVFMTPYRAILFQKEMKPLTEIDKKLEDYILDKYTHIRDTPFI